MTSLSSLRNVCVRDLPNVAHSKTQILWKGRQLGQLFMHTRNSPQKNRMGFSLDLPFTIFCSGIGASLLGAVGGAAHGFHTGMTKQPTAPFPEKIVSGVGNAILEGAAYGVTGLAIGVTAPVSIPALAYYYFKHSK